MNSKDVSIIIPVYNDPDGLRNTIESLVPQINDSCEVIIADNNSTDETSQVAMKCAEHTGISYIEANEIQSSYYARNRGIERSTGKIISFLDANMQVEESFIKDIYEQINTTGWDYMGCDVEIINIESSVGSYNAAMTLPIERYVSKQAFAPTCSLVVTRKLVNDIGKFDQRLISGGDVEFGYRANASGYDLHFQSNITTDHPARNNIYQIITRQMRISYGHCQLAKYYPDQFPEGCQTSLRDVLPVNPLALSNRSKKEITSMQTLMLWSFYSSLKKIIGNFGKLQYKLEQMTDRVSN